MTTITVHDSATAGKLPQCPLSRPIDGDAADAADVIELFDLTVDPTASAAASTVAFDVDFGDGEA